MAENKTQPAKQTVADFIASIPDPAVQKDCIELDKVMGAITGENGVMWGTAIVGYGKYHYKYAMGREYVHYRIFTAQTKPYALRFG